MGIARSLIIMVFERYIEIRVVVKTRASLHSGNASLSCNAIITLVKKKLNVLNSSILKGMQHATKIKEQG